MKFTDDILKEFTKDREKAKKISSSMLSEFNRVKNASELSRASQSRTGSIDTKRLKRYLLDDDIFRRKVNLPNGDNYSFHILIDWSGSMQGTVSDVMNQAIAKAFFFRAAGVSFEIMFFSSRNELSGALPKQKDNTRAYINNNDVSLVTLCKSGLDNKTFEKSIKYMWFLSKLADRRIMLKHGLSYDNHNRKFAMHYSLGGTPLNTALTSLVPHLNKYRKVNNIQKQKLVIMTDGATAPIQTTQGSCAYDNIFRYNKNMPDGYKFLTTSGKTLKPTVAVDNVNKQNAIQQSAILSGLDDCQVYSIYLLATHRLTNPYVRSAMTPYINPFNSKHASKLYESCKKNQGIFGSIKNFSGFDEFFVAAVRSEKIQKQNDFENKTAKQIAKSMVKTKNTKKDQHIAKYVVNMIVSDYKKSAKKAA
jgi:hypothetical protein